MADDDGWRGGLAAAAVGIYGATVAFYVAGLVNLGWLERFGLFRAMVFAGPVTEEVLKLAGVSLALPFLRSAGETGRAGAAAGFGFGLAEMFADADRPDVFVLRVLGLPMHAGYGALAGMGLGFAVRDKQWWMAPLGLAGAILLHGTHNLSYLRDSFGLFLAILLLSAAALGLALSLPGEPLAVDPGRPAVRGRRPPWMRRR